MDGVVGNLFQSLEVHKQCNVTSPSPNATYIGIICILKETVTLVAQLLDVVMHFVSTTKFVMAFNNTNNEGNGDLESKSYLGGWWRENSGGKTSNLLDAM